MSRILVESARELGRRLAQGFREPEPAGEDLQPPTGGHGIDGDEWVKALPFERTMEVEG